MAILITGAAGFLGRHLSQVLRTTGHTVFELDIMPPNENENERFIQGNLVTQEGFDCIPWEDIDVVYHLASAGVKPDSRQWPTCIEVNIQGTLNLLEKAASTESHPAFIYTHSFYEDALASVPALRENPYILTKSVSTTAVRTFANRYPGAVVDLCVFQVYGPGDASTTVLPYVCRQLIQNQPAVLGSGTGLRDWIHVDDVICGLISAMSAGTPGQISTYDLGSGRLVSIREMAEQLASLLNGSDLLVFDPEKDRPDTELNIKAERFIPGWTCRINPGNGLKDLANYYKNGVCS